MTRRVDKKVHLIPIDEIEVLNPRSRGKTKFKQIVDNIAKLGLKRPVLVAQHPQSNGRVKFYLVCGQGRLEAFKALGETEIPALLCEGTKEDLLLMSLAENLARRQHSHVELLTRLRNLRDLGYTYTEISRKTDLAVSYVTGILKLLEKGEERLVPLVEKGKLPLTVAIKIAAADDKAVQKALTEAYEKNELRGKQLLEIRRLLAKTANNGKDSKAKSEKNHKPTTTQDLLETYQRETARQKLVVQKAKVCETSLLVAISAVKQLFDDQNFVKLLRAESLDTLPKYVATQINQMGDES